MLAKCQIGHGHSVGEDGDNSFADAGMAAVEIDVVFPAAVLNRLCVAGKTALMALCTGVDPGAEGDVVIGQADVPAAEVIDIGADPCEGVQIVEEMQQLLVVKEYVHGCPLM